MSNQSVENESMEEISFLVLGSAEEPYRVDFVKRSNTSLSAYCTCPAGENGQYCKHRFSILDGINKGIVSNNQDQVLTIQSWLSGTELEAAIIIMKELNAEAERIKKALTKAKKNVARAMRD
jgi:uncharacterized Zn finger protein